MPLLNKPKRTLSNLSLQDFSKAKDFCRNSFQQYKHQFHYEPDWTVLQHNHKSASSYHKKKKSEADQILSSAHSYSLQFNRTLTAFKRYKPTENSNNPRTSTPSLANRKTDQIKDDPSRTSKKLSELFQNQHLSTTLQINEAKTQNKQTFQNQNSPQNHRFASEALNRTSLSSKKLILKSGLTEFKQEINQQILECNKQGKQHIIGSILSKRDNFYNPYSIRAKPIDGKSIKPIRHLKSSSIRELKRLCTEERNLNFGQKLNQKENAQGLRKKPAFRQSEEYNFFSIMKKQNPVQIYSNGTKNMKVRLQKKKKTVDFSQMTYFQRSVNANQVQASPQ